MNSDFIFFHMPYWTNYASLYKHLPSQTIINIIQVI
jgi:hypothetical protein